MRPRPITRREPVTRLDYPFEDDKEKLDKKLASAKYKKLGADIHDAIRATRPYTRGGHPGLRGLHDLDILDKHEITLPVYLVARARIPMMQQIAQMTGHPLMRMLARGGYYPVHEGSKLSIRKDLGEPVDVLDFSGAKPIPQLPPGLPLAEKPIVEVLKGFSQLSAQVVAAFERKFGAGIT